MTANVPKWWPTAPAASALHTGEPHTSGIAQTFVDEIAHLCGYQMPTVMEQSFGSSEGPAGVGGAGAFTYHLLFDPSDNARALVFAFLPRGNVDSGAPYNGTIAVASAETTTPINVRQRYADITDLGDLAEWSVFFSRPQTTFADVTFTTTDVQLHHVVVYSVPRALLSGTLVHLDRSFAAPERFITDDVSGTLRGFKQLLVAQRYAQQDGMRRHWNAFWNPGVVHTPSASNVWETVTTLSNMALRGRNVKGSATANAMACRGFLYPTAFGTGTWEFRIVGDLDTSGTSSAFTGTAEWKGATSPPTQLSHGVDFHMRANTVDTVRYEVQRTAGAGSLTINGFSVIEEPI